MALVHVIGALPVAGLTQLTMTVTAGQGVSYTAVVVEQPDRICDFCY